MWRKWFTDFYERKERAKVELEKEQKENEEKRNKCEHRHFIIYGHNLIGDATCLDCGYVDSMYIFYNVLMERLIRLAEKLEAKDDADNTIR